MPTDKQLLESELLTIRWQRGDRSAFEGIVKLWEKPLLYYLRRLTTSEADAWELLQETWLKLVRSLGSLKDTRSLPSFLYTTARNTAISRFRQLDSEESSSFAENLPDLSAADDVGLFEKAEEVHQALDQLPVQQREVLTLFFLQDLSLQQMAALLRLPVGTVKSRLFYAKQAIRKILTRDNRAVMATFDTLNKSAIEKTPAEGDEYGR